MLTNNYIILFDGVCNLCNKSVQFVIKHDKKNRFKFTSLQSDAAKELLLQNNINKNLLSDLNTIILVKNNIIYTHSTAILHITKELDFPVNFIYYFKIIPKSLRDKVYSFIAKNRYKWYGKKDNCMVPTKEIKNKFI